MDSNPGSDLSAKRLQVTTLLSKLMIRQHNMEMSTQSDEIRVPFNLHHSDKPQPQNLESTQEDMPQLDGPIELEGKRKHLGGDVCVVFVHAGAGYHSVQNERTHLAACEESVAPFVIEKHLWPLSCEVHVGTS